MFTTEICSVTQFRQFLVVRRKELWDMMLRLRSIKMAAGSSLWLLPSFILLCIVSSVMTYTVYDIASDRVCSSISKRELSLSLSRPLLVRDSGRLLSRWPGIKYFRCKWEVESKGRGTGVVAVIQLLKFRRSGYAECADFVQFTNSTSKKVFKIKVPKKKEKEAVKLVGKTVGKMVDLFKEDKESSPGPRLCGPMMFGHYLSNNGSLIVMPVVSSPAPPTPPPPANSAVSIISTIFNRPQNPWAGLVSRGSSIDPKGELKTTVYVEAKPLRTDETLELAIIFSGFVECDGRSIPSSLFHCGYGLCISASLVDDGFVNCPFGDCIDEKNCTAALASNRTLELLGGIPLRSSRGLSPGVTATSSFFGIAVLVTIAACICFIIRRTKKKRESTPSEGETAAYPSQHPNGDYVGVPTNTTLQNAEQPGAVPFQQPPPAAPPIGFYVPPPGSGGLPPVGAPYPGANAPMQYPPQPHQYPTVAAPYPVQPQVMESPPPYNSLFPKDKN